MQVESNNLTSLLLLHWPRSIYLKTLGGFLFYLADRPKSPIAPPGLCVCNLRPKRFPCVPATSPNQLLLDLYTCASQLNLLVPAEAGRALGLIMNTSTSTSLPSQRWIVCLLWFQRSFLVLQKAGSPLISWESPSNLWQKLKMGTTGRPLLGLCTSTSSNLHAMIVIWATCWDRDCWAPLSVKSIQ